VPNLETDLDYRFWAYFSIYCIVLFFAVNRAKNVFF